MASHRLLALLVVMPTGLLWYDVIAIERSDTSLTTKELLVSRYGQSTFLQRVQTDDGPYADPYDNRKFSLDVSIERASCLLTRGF